jgi:Pectate lyase superfamily protein
MRMKNNSIVTLFCFFFCASTFAATTLSSECASSSLWGISGERWSPRGRLPDFSYAGYHAGERRIPKPSARWNLKRDFKAKGDGRTDDSAALLKAIHSIKSGVLFIPAGIYVITQRIDINKGNLILRGAGPGKTVLLFPNSLTDLFGNNAKSTEQSQWSFRPGLINVTGKDPIDATTRFASVVAPAKRGDKTLRLSKRISVAEGEWIRLVESDPVKGDASTGSLIHHLYGDLMPAGEGLIGTPHVVRFLSRVKSMSAKGIELERPLPYDVRAEWTPEIHRFVPTVREFGVEHLSIHFPWTPYLGHFREKGYNGLFLQDVAQCWIDDVEIQNSDFAVDMNSTNFCTVANVKLTTSATRAVSSEARGFNGHHGIDVSHGTENLVSHFDVQTKFVHDISVEWYALHSVFANGRGVDLNMDHHREANYASLFSNLDCGAGSRPFDSGGSGNWGAHSGAYSTFWNIRAVGRLKLPPPDFGPLLNFIGLGIDAGNRKQIVETGAADGANRKGLVSPYQWLIEPQSSASICPVELHEAMRLRRLKLSNGLTRRAALSEK